MALGFKRKKRFTFTDPLIVKMTFDQEYDPENNETVRQIIDDIAPQEQDQGLQPISETLPFATFQTAEDLFERIRDDIAAPNATVVSFEELAVYEYNADKRINKSNPEELLVISDFEIGYDYQNLTKIIFEDIFNNVDNADIEYNEKLQYVQSIKKAYQDSLNVGEDDIARIPDMTEANSGEEVDLNVPSFAYNGGQPNVFPVTDSGETLPPANAEDKEQENGGIIDFGGEFSDSNSGVTVSEEQAPFNNDWQQEEFPVHVPDTPSQSVQDDMAVTPTAENLAAQAMEKGNVIAPKFDIETLASVPPEDPNYVLYMLNESKKNLNKVLRADEDKINAQNARTILNIQTENNEAVQQSVEAFKADNTSLDNLHDQVEQEIKIQKDSEYTNRQQELLNIKDQELNQAKSEYEAQVTKINQNYDSGILNLAQQLKEKYEQLAQDTYSSEFDRVSSQLNADADKIYQANKIKYDIATQDSILDLVTKAQGTLKQVFDECSLNLEQQRQTFEKAHLEALDSKTAADRAEAEKKHMVAPYEQNRQLQATLTEIKTQLSKTEADRDGLERQNQDLKANLVNLQELLKQAQSKPQILPDSNSKDNPLDELIRLKVLEMTQQNQNLLNNSGVTSDPKDSTHSDKGENNVTSHKKRNLVIKTVAIATLAFSGAGAVAYGLYDMQKQSETKEANFNNQLIKNDAKLDSAIKALAQSSSSEKNTKSDSESYQVSTSNKIDTNETQALRDNDLDAVKKADNATYQNLDEALLNGNSEWTKSALNALPDLNLADLYRAKLTIELLNKNGDKNLANSVQKAN